MSFDAGYLSSLFGPMSFSGMGLGLGPQPTDPRVGGLPSDPFLTDGWKPDRKEAWRDAALAAGQQLLAGAGKGDWGGLLGGVAAGTQAFGGSLDEQRTRAEQERAKKWEYRRLLEGDLAKRKAAWEEQIGANRDKQQEVQALTDRRRYVDRLPEKYRDRFTSDVMQDAGAFTRLYQGILDDIAKDEEGPEPKHYAGYTLVPDADSKSGYRVVPHAGADLGGGGRSGEGRGASDSRKLSWEDLNDEVSRRIGGADRGNPEVRAAVTRAVLAEAAGAGYDVSGLGIGGGAGDDGAPPPPPGVDQATGMFTGEGMNPGVLRYMQTIGVPQQRIPDLMRKIQAVLAQTAPAQRAEIWEAMKAELRLRAQGM